MVAGWWCRAGLVDACGGEPLECRGELLCVLEVVDPCDAAPSQVEGLHELVLVPSARDGGADVKERDRARPPRATAHEHVVEHELNAGKEAEEPLEPG